MQLRVLLAATALLLLAPGATAASPDEAPALWDEAHPDQAGAVRSVVIEPDPVPAGDQFRASITFAPDYEVEDVRYQICEVGNACFAIGVPLTRDGDTWALDTTDLPEHVPSLPNAPDFRGGQRIGVQFFVYPAGAGEEEYLLFPEGLSEDDALYEEDFVAWSETHYLATTIQTAEREAPGVGVVLFLAAVAVSAVVRRR